MTTRTKPEPAIPVLPNGEAATVACWSCGDMRAAHFCQSCGSVQPPMPTDYFSFFGLPRQMNLDTAALERSMLALSRRLHPDVYARATPQEQEWSLEQTSKLNDAYRTLRDPLLRTEYLLRLEGIKFGEQSKQATEQARATGEKKQAVPPDLLEEVFEVNLQLEELRANRKYGNTDAALVHELEAAKQNFERKLVAIDAELRARWSEWDALNPHLLASRADVGHPSPERRAVLDRMVDVLNRRRYVQNLVREMAAVLAE